MTLLGTEAGPDLVASEDSASADVRAFLAGINNALFSDTTQMGRITRIEIYEPGDLTMTAGAGAMVSRISMIWAAGELTFPALSVVATVMVPR